MRKLGLLLIALSFVLGAIALWAIRSLGAPPAVAATTLPAPRTTVVVAARPIGLGEPLTGAALKEQAWPEGATPPGAFRSVAELTAGAPRYALGPIAANEVILPRRVSGAGGRATLSGAIRAGMRASTIRIDDVVGVAGFVLPGDFVDVLVTRKDGAPSPVMRTDMLLQAVRVLAVDQVANENKNDPVVAKAATIEVTPEQAQKLALASQVGTLSLALRSAEDAILTKAAVNVRTVREQDLRLDGVGAAPARPRVHRIAQRSRASAGGSTIEILHGSDARRVTVRPE